MTSREMKLLTLLTGVSLLLQPHLSSSQSLLDDLSDPGLSLTGCHSSQDLYWSQVKAMAGQQLARLRRERRETGGREKRDGYGHEDDHQLVVRCKHGYTGQVSLTTSHSSTSLRTVLLPGHPSPHGKRDDQHHEHD